MASLGLEAEADKALEKVPILNADTVNKVLLPWIEEQWQEL